MASKGPRSKLDHDTRARRQKALEAPKEPPRPKAHWDHVLEEMVWLSKDFESERKWKLTQAKKVAVRASKSILEHATRGEKKVKEEEQRMRKVAANISKDVKKFWMKIEKLVLYKHQLELEERKKKALDKQLNFLLGQTERYSTMLAENLVDKPNSFKQAPVDSGIEQTCILDRERDKNGLTESTSEPVNHLEKMESDDDYGLQSEEEPGDDEQTIDEDEALITEAEQEEELAALQNEADQPLEEILKSYMNNTVSREVSPEGVQNVTEPVMKPKDHINDSWNQVNGSKHAEESVDAAHQITSVEEHHSLDRTIQNRKLLNSNHLHHMDSNGNNSCLEGNFGIKKLQSKSQPTNLNTTDKEYLPHSSDDERDDETTLSEEEKLADEEAQNPLDEIKLLEAESEVPLAELLARYRKDAEAVHNSAESECACSSSDDLVDKVANQDFQCKTSYGPSNEDPLDLENSAQLNEGDVHIDEVEVENNSILERREGEDIIADAAAAARSAQPTGNTYSTTKVRTKLPFLLKHSLREYQHIGLDWLVTMYEKRLNGILADEMGLGKTIMTIALLAHLACEKGIWGPHLIVVPTSVMLNWETEFLKWCPAFKILTYFGSAKERKHKRQGWLKLNSFHVCITTYRLVIQDSKVFKRKKWKYLILDEAHLIKNWKSQRWQTLLNFNSKRRILLTGTPLQNDLMELWSLMHFLMPHIFQSHQEFKDWFSNPISGMVEGQEKVNKEVVDRLHNVLRPFILRRLKRDVEKQLPKKFEHVIYCRLSKRQRNLYEDFIASSETQATLASANYFGMISVIMQLRKVCNHPDLFEGRPIISSYDMAGINMQLSSLISTMFSPGPFSEVDLKGCNFVFTQHDFNMTSWETDEVAAIASSSKFLIDSHAKASNQALFYIKKNGIEKCNYESNIFEEFHKALLEERLKESKARAATIAWWNSLRCKKRPIYGTDLRELVTVKHPVVNVHDQKNNPSCYLDFSSKLADIILSPVERLLVFVGLLESFMFAIPAARAPFPTCWCSRGRSPVLFEPSYIGRCTEVFAPLLTPIRPAIVRRQVYFPDRRLIQFDCGKLQELAILLRRLKSEGHRALIFTQMTKMLDILEAFINLYGYTYMRLDGSTQPEERQTLMQRFNTNPKFFLFILSTRSGGVGINLVGADTVIFYDSDWNPAMDQQAQDRCHRIGQTREVHIYRLISESTIEENILKKANQKRVLDDLVIQGGSYNTEFFKKLDPMELFSGHRALPPENLHKGTSEIPELSHSTMGADLSNADVEAAIKHAEDEADYMALKRVEQEEAVDNQEFTEEAIGRLEDDDLLNEDDIKADDRGHEEQGCWASVTSKNTDVTTPFEGGENEENALALAEGDEDIDMLADVKQMAAVAVAAGHASSSFENQLRPVDRYAMRFLDLWDPIIDKSVIDLQVNLQEEEWELDRIEKLKDELEAEIDEDHEPFLYERWDADFATTAYRQHVETLAQRQLMEEQECEDQMENDGGDENCDVARREASDERKQKSKKKQKKTKFKSLKKGPLASELDTVHEEPLLDFISDDDKAHSLGFTSPESPPCSPVKKKRKKATPAPYEESSKKNSKKRKRTADCNHVIANSFVKQHVQTKDLDIGEGINDSDLRPSSRVKVGGKVSIITMPVKRVLVVRPERLKKRGHVWSKDCFPPPDAWSSSEDAMLCAAVHEYGTNWSLVSDVLYDIPGGGYHRGRFRHPVHCCERFRELFFKYVTSTTDNSNTEKINSSGSGKALLKVTEDHVRTLLAVTSELADNELLLQKHYVAVLASVWRAKYRTDRCQTVSSQNGFHSNRFLGYLSGRMPRRLTENSNLVGLRKSMKLILMALNDADKRGNQGELPVSRQTEAPARDQLDLTLDFPVDKENQENDFPPTITVSISEDDHPSQSAEGTHESTLLSEHSVRVAENRLRLSSEACFEGEARGWASAAFPTSDVVRYKPGMKSQSLGKHKSVSDSAKLPKSKVLRVAESNEDCTALTSGSLAPSSIMDCPSSPCHNNSWDDDLGTSFTMDVPLQDTTVPHEFDPNFITGLEDLGSLLNITDVG
ncbi:DNA helicase protein [Dioscorea alata]|uniref:DNA helicase protein n=1 Tax=Dioscorea alata TaxID=55571 RepID=A0ACB7TSJ2_DIOAL|nr:DNA helicase protein [Dioscorea alata]